jgi:hypothetical protein
LQDVLAFFRALPRFERLFDLSNVFGDLGQLPACGANVC